MSRIDTDQARARAEARFIVAEQRRTAAEVALAEVAAAKVAEQEKTARLRALRLAKEAEERSAPPVARKTARRKAN